MILLPIPMPGKREFLKLFHPGYAFGSSIMFNLPPVGSVTRLHLEEGGLHRPSLDLVPIGHVHVMYIIEDHSSWVARRAAAAVQQSAELRTVCLLYSLSPCVRLRDSPVVYSRGYDAVCGTVCVAASRRVLNL